MGLNYSLTLRIISIYLLGGIFGKCEQDQAPKCLTEKSDSFYKCIAQDDLSSKDATLKCSSLKSISPNT